MGRGHERLGLAKSYARGPEQESGRNPAVDHWQIIQLPPVPKSPQTNSRVTTEISDWGPELWN
jgi:hypothetical protein